MSFTSRNGATELSPETPSDRDAKRQILQRKKNEWCVTISDISDFLCEKDDAIQNKCVET